MIQAQIERIDKLEQQHILPKEELITLLDGPTTAEMTAITAASAVPTQMPAVTG